MAGRDAGQERLSELLLKGARDAFIGKRVALKLSYERGEGVLIRFAPSLEFVYEPDDKHFRRVKKAVFFYSTTSATVTDKGKQRIWKQRYCLRDGRCYLDEGIFNGFGAPVEITHEGHDTGLDFVPVYVIVNGGLSGDLLGESDVAELTGGQDAYDRTKSDDIDALKYSMFGQKVFTDASPESMENIRIEPNAMIDLQTEPGSAHQAKAEVLETQFSYGDHMTQTLDRIKDDLHELLSVPRITPDLLTGLGTSGKAMRALYWSLNCRCEERWATGWDAALTWMVDTALKLARAHGEKLPEIAYTLNIEHLYPVMDDDEEERALDLNEVNAQARSRRSYIEKWQADADPDAELRQIAQEQRLLEDTFESSAAAALRGACVSLADELARIARRKLLSQITTTDRLVRMQYIRAANDIAKEIRTAKRGSLTERWLVSYKRELDREIERLGRNIYGAVDDGAQAAAQARMEATAEYLRRAAAQARIDDSFVSTISTVPTDAVRAVVEGRLYTDGRKLSARIWSATGRLEGNISQILQQGVAQQMDALTLARHLEAYVNPEAACPVSWHKIYPDIPFDRKIDYNALRLARTTLTHAHWLAGREAARKNPLCRGIKWHLSDQHYERQIAVAGEDVCDEYARHDEGLGKGVWSIDRLPLPHPQCLCYQMEELPSLEEAADFLGAWVRGERADAAMESGFQKWQKENAAELNNWYAEEQTRLSGRQSFTDNDVTRAASLANADIPAEIISGIESAYRRITGDFPALDAMTGRFRFEDESGGGAFGYMYRPDGMMEASILLDRDIFASAQSLKAYFERHLAEGHTRNASDPMFIVSHELGHALHTAAAARELGISLDKPITSAQYELIKAKRKELAVDVYLHVPAFESEEYNTFEAIRQAVDKEMGRRGTYNGLEFIAQSVAMVYNGDGAHPIADAVVRYLKEKLR